MWRAFFLGVGAYVALLGVESLAVEKAVMKPEMVGPDKLIKRQEIVPPGWAPWSLMGAGAVTVLYSITILQRVATKKGSCDTTCRRYLWCLRHSLSS